MLDGRLKRAKAENRDNGIREKRERKREREKAREREREKGEANNVFAKESKG